MKGIKINKKFAPLWEEKEARYFIITGGRGSSKSFTVNLSLTQHTFKKNVKVLFTRYTMVSAKLSIIPEFEEKIDLLNANNHFNILQNEIENLYSGSLVIFKGIKTSSGVQTAALKSLQGITDWIVDEAEELTDEATFDKINLSIRQQGAHNRIMLILNPTTKEHWIYKRFFEGKGVEPGFNGKVGDTVYIHTTYLDNIKNLDQSFINEVESIKETNPTKFNNVVLGGWLDRAEGVIFTNWKPGELDESLIYFYGLDFGFSIDPTALTRVAVDRKTKRIYIEELLYKKHLSAEEIHDHIKVLVKRNSPIIADSADPRMIDFLKKKGHNVKGAEKGADSIRYGLALMTDYQLIVKGVNMTKELNNYVWHDKKSNTPIDAYNDLIDSARYAVSHILKPRSKSSGIVYIAK